MNRYLDVALWYCLAHPVMVGVTVCAVIAIVGMVLEARRTELDDED